MQHLDRFLAKRDHTSDVGWSFLCVLEIHFIQFVNEHNIDDGEPPWLVIILFFLGVTMTTNLPNLSSSFFFPPQV